MPFNARAVFGVLILGLLPSSAPLAAYQQPLSSTDIRNAYFLGSRNDENTAEFFSQYDRLLPVPKSGPSISKIEVRTPYAQVVERTTALLGYSAQKAQEDFLARPAIFIVRVSIALTPSYPDMLSSKSGVARLRSDDFWRDFKVRVVQGQEITAHKIRGWPTYSSGGEDSSHLSGAEIELQYEIAKIASSPVQIEVLTPDGQQVVADFDLSKLR
jgi:hypothetical protein